MNYQHLKQLIEEHKVIHLCGIGGVSMRALARLLQQMGATVQGSDRDHSPAVAMLRRQDITVYIGHSAQQPRPTVWPSRSLNGPRPGAF